MPSSTIIAHSGLIATGTALKTMLQLLAPATCDFEIFEIYTGAAAAPSNTTHTAILWQVMLQTSAGTGGDAITEVAWPGSSSATDLGTAITEASTTWTAEPAASSVYLNWLTPTVAPGYTWRGSLLVPAGTRIGVTATSAQDVLALTRFLYRRA